LGSTVVRPRQARYQAALRPDMRCARILTYYARPLPLSLPATTPLFVHPVATSPGIGEAALRIDEQPRYATKKRQRRRD
jgi:hypothetical protein